MEVEDLLEHHGVKGMKWGIRNDKGHEGERTKTRKIARLDKKFARGTRNLSTTIAIHNAAAAASNKNDIPRINNKPAYKGKDFSKDSPLRKKYYAEHRAAFVDNLEKAAKDMGTNASGTKQYTILENEDHSWDIKLKNVKHANVDDDSSSEGTVKVNYDKGYITSLKVITSVGHSFDVTEFLEHHGVKGMRWGIRNRRNRVKTAKRPPSSDSKRISDLKKRKPSQLTDKQLKDVNARLNLESNFSRLNPSTVKKGHEWTKNAMALISTGAAIAALSQTPTGKRITARGLSFLQSKFGNDVLKRVVVGLLNG